ncbi:MAG TPA: immunoglobulin domain-containing protein [Candidatus Angelobacter sp.]|nr:immunoglobulin domain-containing protein [Candidatus Angelobacter sp.]
MTLDHTLFRKRLLFILVGMCFAGLAQGQGVFTLQIGAPPSPPTPLVNHADVWRYHKGTNAPQAGWQTISDASLDGTWASGNGGIGYADNANETSLCQTLLADMLNRYTTVYMRRSFQISDAVDSNLHILLTMDWDDGFVAYLDGVEIQRSLAPGAAGVEPAFDAVASGLHESSRGNSAPLNPPGTFDLGPVGGRLAPGTHVLAILGLNQAPGSSDFIQIADLQLSGASTAVGGGQFLSVVQSNYVILSGSNTVAGSTRVVINGDDAGFDQAQGTWSRTQTLLPGVNQFFVAALDGNGAILASTNRIIVSELSSTFVGGTLAGSSVWDSSMGIIHVTNTVVVPPGDTLTIQPGAVLLLSPGVSIAGTNSSITAAGAPGNAIYFLPADGTTVWGELTASGTSGNLLLQHVETIAGFVEIFDGAVGTLEDSYLHDYEVSSPAIIHTLGLPNHITLNLRRCHVAHYYEVLSQYGTNHIEDCLLEYQGNSGDGIDFDAGQPGSYIRRCTVRRGLLFNTDALDMGEYGGTGEGSRGILIDSCLLRDFVDKGVSMGVGVDVTVTNTLIFNVDTGIAVKDNSTAGIYNCTIADNNFGFRGYNKADPSAPGGGGYITNSFNNILWNNGTSLSLSNGSTLTATYSDFQGTNYPGTGNIDNDPLFLNSAEQDYHVAPSSPTLGAGLGGANMGVTFPVGGIPGAPLGLAATGSITDPITLVWVDDADNEDGLVIERSTDAATWQILATPGPNVTNYTDTSAVTGQKYYYRAKATNGSGESAYSNIAGGTRQPSQVFVGGAIATDTIWNAGVQYVVTNSVTVNTGVTLTIQPGALVTFDAGQGMTIANGGRLLAEGTANAPILFTRFAPTGYWGNITIDGAVGSPETRIAYARFEFNANSTGTPCIEVAAGTAYLDHLTFGNAGAPYIHVDGASFIISHCYFPTATAAFEPCHGTGGVKSGGRGIFLRNFFGKANGYSDVVDFTGGNRPGQPIVQFIDNVVTGGDDDGFDLDGTDAWVEGNIFLHMHKNGGTPDSSSAVSGGNDSGNTSEITIIHNLIYDCDQAVDAKQGNFYTMINNTIVHQSHVGGVDTDGAIVILADTGTAEGAGVYLEGNLIYDAENLTRNVTTAVVTFTNNLMPFAWSGPGGGNSTSNPMLKQIPQLAETYFTNWADAQILRDWFSLQPGSPAIGTGPNGADKGGVVPLGASISGEPNGTSGLTSATLTVGVNRTGNGIPAAGWPGGSGYTHYKWRLDTNAWSVETPIDTPVSLTGLADGPHYVEVSGRNDADFYQDDPAFAEDAVTTRSRTWTVQTSGAPTITQQPISQTVAQGGTVTFTVVATGTPPLSYQWRAGYLPGDIPGATNDTLVLTNVQANMTGNIRVIVTNSAGSTPSDIATLTVVVPPSLGSVGFDGTNVVFSFASASNLTYQVEYKNTLNDPAWAPLKSISGNGGVLSVMEPPTNFPGRFYRLRVE